MTVFSKATLTLSSLFLLNCGGTPSIHKKQPKLLASSTQELSPEIKDAMARNNEIRNDLYSNAPIKWNSILASSAQAYANRLANTGSFEHSGISGYGENLFWSTKKSSYTDAINAWFGEVEDYDFATYTCKAGKVCGHYTQLIWKNTKQVGCGKALYKRGANIGATVIVCQYNPPGNYRGQKPF